MFTSSLAQAEISGEGSDNLNIFLNWLRNGKIDYLFFSSNVLPRFFDAQDVHYLPAPSTTDFSNFERQKPFTDVNSIGLINDNAPHKNILNSLLGISLSNCLDKLVVNGFDKSHSFFADFIGLGSILDDVGFLQNDTYEDTVSSLKLMVYLSFSESYCYSVFEAMSLGVPVIVSRAVNWVDVEELIVNNPRDPQEISEKIDYVLSLDESSYLDLSKRCRHNARRSIQENNEFSRKVLEEVLGER
ncbi:MAG: glycosyltransferase [Candidatus Paceibacteria bacterium]